MTFDLVFIFVLMRMLDHIIHFLCENQSYYVSIFVDSIWTRLINIILRYGKDLDVFTGPCCLVRNFLLLRHLPCYKAGFCRLSLLSPLLPRLGAGQGAADSTRLVGSRTQL